MARRAKDAPRGGIDVGGTKIQAVVVDSGFKPLGQARRPTPTSGGPADVVAQMAQALTEAAQGAGVKPASLRGVGVGMPGGVDAAAGTVTGAGNLPDWKGSFAAGPALEQLVGSAVVIGNDVQVATDAEHKLGAGRECRSLLGVFWGTGVGGGLILDGKPWVGRGAAGEIGHVVVKIGGARCTCGRRGCMEAYAGRASMELRARKLVDKGHTTKLFKLMDERQRTRLTSGVWARALEHDDKLAAQIIRALGAGVASAVNLLDVEAVIIGGGLGVRLGEPYAKRIAEAMAPHLFTDGRPPTVHPAGLGDLGGAIGAAMLVGDGQRGRRRSRA
jgi:glucokinase